MIPQSYLYALILCEWPFSRQPQPYHQHEITQPEYMGHWQNGLRHPDFVRFFLDCKTGHMFTDF